MLALASDSLRSKNAKSAAHVALRAELFGCVVAIGEHAEPAKRLDTLDALARPLRALDALPPKVSSCKSIVNHRISLVYLFAVFAFQIGSTTCCSGNSACICWFGFLFWLVCDGYFMYRLMF